MKGRFWLRLWLHINKENDVELTESIWDGGNKKIIRDAFCAHRVACYDV